MRYVLAIPLVLALAMLAWSGDLLGPCGTAKENQPAAPVAATPEGNLVVAPILLPGQRAHNFELTAVVGDDLKSIKLSDFNGKWRVLCFYPADFTFV